LPFQVKLFAAMAGFASRRRSHLPFRLMRYLADDDGKRWTAGLDSAEWSGKDRLPTAGTLMGASRATTAVTLQSGFLLPHQHARAPRAAALNCFSGSLR